MFFWLKKCIGYLILPVPVTLILLLLAVVLLSSKRHARAGRLLVLVTALGFLLLANKAFSVWLVRPLEMQYAAIPELSGPAAMPADLARCRYIVVLGGGNGNTPGLAAVDLLSTSALGRIVEGVRIARMLPEATLLVSGPAPSRAESHATVLERSAISLGIDRSRIKRIEHARDTEDESLAVRRLAGDAPVAVVTSAWHMPRTMALFRKAGVAAVACPADYSAHSDGVFRWNSLLWDVESLERSTFAIRERVGYLWISLRGRAAP